MSYKYDYLLFLQMTKQWSVEQANSVNALIWSDYMSTKYVHTDWYCSSSTTIIPVHTDKCPKSLPPKDWPQQCHLMIG
jgi:hypothetical protein